MKKHIKVNRIFTNLKKYSWTLIFIIAVLGLWVNKLGLIMIPMMITIMIMGMLQGKYWCGNVCPHGSLFDGILYPISSHKSFGKILKSKILSSIMFIFFMTMMVNKLVRVFHSPTADFWDKLGMVFVSNYLMVTIVGSLFAIFVNSRSWCSICPMGTMQKIMIKLSKFIGLSKRTERKVSFVDANKCVSCGKCSKVCPMQLDVYKEIDTSTCQLNNHDCIKCGVCVVNCPLKTLEIKK